MLVRIVWIFTMPTRTAERGHGALRKNRVHMWRIAPRPLEHTGIPPDQEPGVLSHRGPEGARDTAVILRGRSDFSIAARAVGRLPRGTCQQTVSVIVALRLDLDDWVLDQEAGTALVCSFDPSSGRPGPYLLSTADNGGSPRLS